MNCAADECGYSLGFCVSEERGDLSSYWNDLSRDSVALCYYSEPDIPLWSKPESVYTQTQEAQTNEHAT